MTEAEWLACPSPRPMADFLGDKLSERKLRLVCCACLRRLWPLLADPLTRAAVEEQERYADGVVTWAHLAEANGKCQTVAFDPAAVAVARGTRHANPDWVPAAEAMAESIAPRNFEHYHRQGDDESFERWWVERSRELAAQADVFREIVANPLRPIAFDPAWRTSDVLGLAQRVYDDHDYASMPILADALADAGCDAAELLDHCRGPGPHVRGCWVVDLVLGKE